jgi:hypothetical protein
MTMVPYDPSIRRPLRWMHNKAPRITSLINQKQDWYTRYNEQFWLSWEDQIFDLATANPFGLVVWCIILGLPLDIFNFEPLTNAFAYGPQRGNYMDGGHGAPFTFVGEPQVYQDGSSRVAIVDPVNGNVTINPPPPVDSILTWSGIVVDENDINTIVTQRQFGVGDGVKTQFNLTPANIDNFNTVGFNFQCGGTESVFLLSDVRFACQLRYVALVSNGRQQWINEMLKYIFNGGEDWDMASGRYFYLTDATEDGSPLPPMTMKYIIGPNVPVSAQFINILNNPQYGIAPQCAGVSYTVVQLDV